VQEHPSGEYDQVIQQILMRIDRLEKMMRLS
jgi:hypothetical protein